MTDETQKDERIPDEVRELQSDLDRDAEEDDIDEEDDDGDEDADEEDMDLEDYGKLGREVHVFVGRVHITSFPIEQIHQLAKLMAHLDIERSMMVCLHNYTEKHTDATTLLEERENLYESYTNYEIKKFYKQLLEAYQHICNGAILEVSKHWESAIQMHEVNIDERPYFSLSKIGAELIVIAARAVRENKPLIFQDHGILDSTKGDNGEYDHRLRASNHDFGRRGD